MFASDKAMASLFPCVKKKMPDDDLTIDHPASILA
jgi:hypothetical protein